MNYSCNIKLIKPFAQLSRNRFLSTTSCCCLIQKWRQDRGLPLNPNASGVLTDKPDYTFLDGRPTPFGTRQKNRILKQREIAEQIIQLSGEIDFAVKHHEARVQTAEQAKQNIISNKLKPKGDLLLKKK